jgi:hypothetical protein
LLKQESAEALGPRDQQVLAFIDRFTVASSSAGAASWISMSALQAIASSTRRQNLPGLSKHSVTPTEKVVFHVACVASARQHTMLEKFFTRLSSRKKRDKVSCFGIARTN